VPLRGIAAPNEHGAVRALMLVIRELSLIYWQASGRGSKRSAEVRDAAISDSAVNDATAEIRTGTVCAGFRRVGGGAAERTELSLPANQEIQGPAVGSSQLERAGADGVAFVGERAQEVSPEEDSGSIADRSIWLSLRAIRPAPSRIACRLRLE